MKKKWRIYPRGTLFWIAFGLLMIICGFFISCIIIVGYTKDGLVLEIILTVIFFLLLSGLLLAFS